MSLFSLCLVSAFKVFWDICISKWLKPNLTIFLIKNQPISTKFSSQLLCLVCVSILMFYQIFDIIF